MPNGYVEPLDEMLWLAQIAKLQKARAHLQSDGIDTLLRRAFYLVQLAPLHLRQSLPIALDEATLENLLDSRAYLSAAVAMLPPPTAFTLTRKHGSALFRASVMLHEDSSVAEDGHGEPAVALLGAWCGAVLSLSSTEEGRRLDAANSSAPARGSRASR